MALTRCPQIVVSQPRLVRSLPSLAPPRLRLRHSSRVEATRSGKFETVQDLMNPDRIVWTCKPDDLVETALELLVEHRISGLPVVDANNIVVGVVSDFDLLALDVLGKSNDTPIFPPTDETWQAFKAVKSALAKGTGKKVRDVMTRDALTVKTTTNINDATGLLLTKRIRRLPVVDEAGRLVGIISRSNIIKCALEMRKASAAH